MLYANQFRKFGFEKRSDNMWNAGNVFHIFSIFNQTIFGYTKFLIKDKNLFKEQSVSSGIIVTLKKSSRTAITARALF